MAPGAAAVANRMVKRRKIGERGCVAFLVVLRGNAHQN